MTRRGLAGWALAAAGAAALSVAAAPYAFAEAFMAAGRLDVDLMPAPANPAQFAARPGKAAGRIVDGHWLVEEIAPGTWAIGEPADAPDNYEYLLIGTRRALLIDGGATKRHDLSRVVAGLTALPVTVIPSHLHYDHTNGLGHFRDIALIDLPETRARADGDRVRLGRYQYEGWAPPEFTVRQWIKPGQTIDLGGRSVTALLTPGHTTSSVSIWETAAKRLYTGDFLYPTTLYAFAPDSSLSTYVATIDQLLGLLPADTRLYGAHCCRNDAPPQAPYLSVGDLKDTRAAILRIQAGTQDSRGVLIRRFPVNSRMTMLTLYPIANR